MASPGTHVPTQAPYLVTDEPDRRTHSPSAQENIDKAIIECSDATVAFSCFTIRFLPLHPSLRHGE